MKHYKWQKWKAYDRKWSDWYIFEITNLLQDIWEDYFIEMKITSWEHKWKYSVIMNNELDNTVKFN